eukprot:CAMPEP_0202856956 /NCGR_PEP_ID=MMETSP1391-20130828/64_1 /ASSEMBLY_ACC=CAM_ASM_000867 /TAXON_ID=1034604 /ORGANISM="Chlamydomonas leiostraca, Strain SAG 11-49" /LENGTH=327 /DNA_ID=CAMNT_0049535685 /DNA_START=529 /DNA_END=1512 /DNA_ORIENTATION=-
MGAGAVLNEQLIPPLQQECSSNGGAGDGHAHMSSSLHQPSSFHQAASMWPWRAPSWHRGQADPSASQYSAAAAGPASSRLVQPAMGQSYPGPFPGHVSVSHSYPSMPPGLQQSAQHGSESYLAQPSQQATQGLYDGMDLHVDGTSHAVPHQHAGQAGEGAPTSSHGQGLQAEDSAPSPAFLSPATSFHSANSSLHSSSMVGQSMHSARSAAYSTHSKAGRLGSSSHHSSQSGGWRPQVLQPNNSWHLQQQPQPLQPLLKHFQGSRHEAAGGSGQRSAVVIKPAAPPKPPPKAIEMKDVPPNPLLGTGHMQDVGTAIEGPSRYVKARV